MKSERDVIAAMLRLDTPESELQRAPPTIHTPGDDAAQIPGGTLVCVDTMIEGVHFDHRLSPSDIGWKLVAVNISDIAACGRRADWALLSIALPNPIDSNWVEEFADGLHKALGLWDVKLIGGDTTKSTGPICLSLTMGSSQQGPFVSRTGAKSGDDVWITGQLGLAAAGFMLDDPAGMQWLKRPTPPVSFAVAVSEKKLVSAMMDLSDGVMADLNTLCSTSQVGATIFVDKLPIPNSLRGVVDPLPYLVGFGEDYQLLFSAPQQFAQAIIALGAEQQVSVTKIGTIMPQSHGVTLNDRDWPSPLYSHFSSK